jgi:hypothetical protein
MSRYYFAYGSNLDAAQMERRCPGSQYRGKALLAKHRLAFTHPSVTWGGGSADILEDEISPGVWGAIYELNAEDWGRLIAAEGKTTADINGYLAITQTRDGRIQLITSKDHYVFNLAWIKALPLAPKK